MGKRLTSEEFISKARVVHGDKYDYSKVDYVDYETKVCIICREHGEFWQKPKNHLVGQGCARCRNENYSKAYSLTTEEFIRRARETHGDRYDYTKTTYSGYHDKVLITCTIHGDFLQEAQSHINGCGCPKCAIINSLPLRRGKVFGIGVITSGEPVRHKPSYNTWAEMLRRCYSHEQSDKWSAYRGCSVCDEWLVFDNFDRWYNAHYVEGWHLDKDILVKGNKVYSPQTCCFVPQIINESVKSNIRKRELPQGVTKKRNKFCAGSTYKGKKYCLGYFDTVDEAEKAFLKKKKELLAELAEEYKDQLEERVYSVLINKNREE